MQLQERDRKIVIFIRRSRRLLDGSNAGDRRCRRRRQPRKLRCFQQDGHYVRYVVYTEDEVYRLLRRREKSTICLMHSDEGRANADTLFASARARHRLIVRSLLLVVASRLSPPLSWATMIVYSDCRSWYAPNCISVESPCAHYQSACESAERWLGLISSLPHGSISNLRRYIDRSNSRWYVIWKISLNFTRRLKRSDSPYLRIFICITTESDSERFMLD